MHQPTVSIGLPVYNGENYLPGAIESLLGQTFRDFELVISDNGSSDRTPALCEKYAAQDTRIRYVRSDVNRGLSWNSDRVFVLAKGKYFTWASHDDLWAPTYLQRCVEVLDAAPDVVLCHSEAEFIDATGKSLGRVESAAGMNSPRPEARFHSALLNVYWCLELSGLIRSAALKDTKRQRNFAGGDKVCVAELSLVGRFERIAETLFYFRVHDQQYSSVPSTASDLSARLHGERKRRITVPRVLVIGWELLWLIPKAPIRRCEKLCCLWGIFRYVFQVHKWGKIVSELFRGKGSSGWNSQTLGERGTAG